MSLACPRPHSQRSSGPGLRSTPVRPEPTVTQHPASPPRGAPGWQGSASPPCSCPALPRRVPPGRPCPLGAPRPLCGADPGRAGSGGLSTGPSPAADAEQGAQRAPGGTQTWQGRVLLRRPSGLLPHRPGYWPHPDSARPAAAGAFPGPDPPCLLPVTHQPLAWWPPTRHPNVRGAESPAPSSLHSLPSPPPRRLSW